MREAVQRVRCHPFQTPNTTSTKAYGPASATKGPDFAREYARPNQAKALEAALFLC